MRQNYGQALELSSPFFDAVRAEIARSPDSELADGLNQVLAVRDGVTAALQTLTLSDDGRDLVNHARGVARLEASRRVAARLARAAGSMSPLSSAPLRIARRET